VTPGGTATLRAESSDPDGDQLSLRWSGTGGTLADTRTATTNWRAETSPGFVTFTVVAEDGRGGTATDTVTIEVKAPERLAFEDVLFDFDHSTLRADAPAKLAPVLAALKQRPELRLVIEGYTCNIGRIEYNKALGGLRANAVKNYLVKNGVAPQRLSTVSYGVERPVASNATEATRVLNRRASVVMRVDEDQ
jgi:outer membrane protein OmpA-like peptidoglycan-associated protein